MWWGVASEGSKSKNGLKVSLCPSELCKLLEDALAASLVVVVGVVGLTVTMSLNSRDSRSPAEFKAAWSVAGLNSRDDLAPLEEETELVDGGAGVDEDEESEEPGFSKTFWNSVQVATTALRLVTYFSLSGESSIARSNASMAAS